MKTETGAPATVVQGRQRNHGDFHLPPSVRDQGDIPLYRAVALWGLHRGTPFTRNDVSLAFRIEPRRASDILNYLCNRCEADDIRLDVSRSAGGQGRGYRPLSLRVLAVAEPREKEAAQAREKEAAHPAKGSSRQNERSLSRWLLSRPSSGDASRLAAWQAACPVAKEA